MKKIFIFIILFFVINSKFYNIQSQSVRNPEYAVILSIISLKKVHYGENYFSGGKRIPIYSLFGYETPIFLDEKTTHTSSYSKELGNLLEQCRIKQIEVTNLIEDIRNDIIRKDLLNDLFSYYGYPEPKFRIRVKEKGKERKLTKKYERVLYKISNSDTFMPYLSISSVLNKMLYPNVSDNSSIPYRLEETSYTNINKNILLPMFENEEVLDAIVDKVVKLASKGYDEEYQHIKDEYEKELILSDIKLITEEEIKEYMKMMQSCVDRLYNTKIKISKLLLENIFYNYEASRFGDIKSYSLFYLKKYWLPNSNNYLYGSPVNAEGSRIFPEYKDFNDFYNYNK